MDPDAFTAALFKWDPRGASVPPPPPPPSLLPPPQPPVASNPVPYAAARPRESFAGLEDLFQAYGIRYYTGAKIAELGFTASTLVNMTEGEIDDMMNSLSHIFRWDLLVGERYGIKAAVRAERRRLEEMEESWRRHQHHHVFSSIDAANNTLDALSHEGLSEEPVQQEREAAGSGGSGGWKVMKQQQRRQKKGGKRMMTKSGEEDEEEDDDEEEEEGRVAERQREHPFIVTEPGEVARGKKNGLDYLFHLYEQCREFLIQVQNLSKDRGEKCPTKVTNQVFRYARKVGASYINKPKMRHYVHCYALHCLDEGASNALRRSFKERGENVGAWRQACYKPLVTIAGRQDWDIDAIFDTHPRLSIWYVPTKLRQLCHAERSRATANATSALPASAPTGAHHLHF